MDFGDITKFLQKHCLDGSGPKKTVNRNTASFKSILKHPERAAPPITSGSTNKQWKTDHHWMSNGPQLWKKNHWERKNHHRKKIQLKNVRIVVVMS